MLALQIMALFLYQNASLEGDHLSHGPQAGPGLSLLIYPCGMLWVPGGVGLQEVWGMAHVGASGDLRFYAQVRNDY